MTIPTRFPARQELDAAVLALEPGMIFAFAKFVVLNQRGFLLRQGLALNFHFIGALNRSQKIRLPRRRRISMFCITQWPPITPGKYLTFGKKSISS